MKKTPKTPKISIIVPVYNVAEYIDQCMESLVNQTMTDIEIICVDDCGTDNSMEIVQKYADADSRVRIIKHEHNMGLSASRNTALKNSSAPYIMCCDSDDYYTPDMCRIMLETLETSGADIAMCGINITYLADHHLKDSDDEYYRIKYSGTVDVDDNVIGSCDVSSWNKIYRREILDKYEIQWPTGLKYEDAYFFYAYMLHAKRIAFTDEKLYCYRRRPGSIMNKTFAKTHDYAIDHLKIAIKLYQYLGKYDLCNKRSDNFWKNIFIPYVNFAIWNTQTKSGMRDVINLASDFVRENYVYGVTDLTIDQTIRQIERKTYQKTKKIWGGIFAIKQNMDKTEYRFLGIPLYKIKNRRNRHQHYFCGIHLFNHHLQDASTIRFNVPKISVFDINNDNLLAELSSMPEFTYIPNPGNMGDMLIAFATLGFFDQNGIKYKLNTGTPDKYIVYGGGGIWTADYHEHWIRLLDSFRDAERVIILPSSFNNCPDLIDALDERFVVFCRERQSYEYMKSQNTRAKIILDHDMAFRINDKTLRNPLPAGPDEMALLNRLRTSRINKTAWFTRRDCESAGSYQSDIDLSSYVYGSDTAPRAWIDFTAMLMLETVARANTIVTDRLHVAIAGILTGRNVFMLDNSYKKLSNVYQHTIESQNKNVKFGLPK